MPMTAAGLNRTARVGRAAPPPHGRRARADQRVAAVAEDVALRALRDQLTDQLLTDGALPGLKVLRRQTWWDGAVEATCLTVQWRRARWRLLVLDSGTVVTLPARSRAARRQLGQYRAALGRPALDESGRGRAAVAAPHAPSPVLPSITGDDPADVLRRALVGRVPSPRSDVPVDVVVVEQVGDWVPCSRPGCAALVPLAPPGEDVAHVDPAGPVCGRCAP